MGSGVTARSNSHAKYLSAFSESVLSGNITNSHGPGLEGSTAGDQNRYRTSLVILYRASATWTKWYVCTEPKGLDTVISTAIPPD